MRETAEVLHISHPRDFMNTHLLISPELPFSSAAVPLPPIAAGFAIPWLF
jgi:hypothetical protein